MSIKKHFEIFVCLFASMYLQITNINFAIYQSLLMQKQPELVMNIMQILNEFKKGDWWISSKLKNGSFSSKIYHVYHCGDSTSYVLKILLPNDYQSYSCEKLACERFKPYLNDENIMQNICPPLECGIMSNGLYYVIYEFAENNNYENLHDRVNFLDVDKTRKRYLDEIIKIWNELLRQKLHAMECLEKVNLLHNDAHSENWRISFYQKENGEFYLKIKLIDFGSVIDISNYSSNSKPIYYPANKKVPSKDPATNHDLYFLCKSLLEDFCQIIGERLSNINICLKIQILINYLKYGYLNKETNHFYYSNSITIKQRSQILKLLYNWLHISEGSYEKSYENNLCENKLFNFYG